MDNSDRFYIDCTSGAVAVFLVANDGSYYIDNDDRKYVDPTAFETYLRTLPPQLWAPEFRSAYATIQGYIERNNDQGNQDFIEALVMAANSIRTLAETYSPEIAKELETLQTKVKQIVIKKVYTKTESIVLRPGLPAGIKDTPGARAAFDSLVDAGYLDSEYKPTASASRPVVCAYMAKTLNQLLGVKRNRWAKEFADFWGISNLSQSLSQLDQRGKEYVVDINKALAAATRNCDQLAQTKRGKELIDKNKYNQERNKPI